MNVVRLHGPGDLRLTSEPKPVPEAGEELVRVTAIGICGSDLHWLEDAGIGESTLDRPLVLGHEFAGVVDGDRSVAVDPAIPCGKCFYCLEGEPNFCEDLHFAGQAADDGALRDFMRWPRTCLFEMPPDMTAADGAMLEPLGVAIHAVDLGKVKPGSTVGIFGCGPVGLLTLQVAIAAGATRVIATDLLEHRLEAARRFGADEAIRAGTPAELGEVLGAAGGGVDVAFEAAGTDEAVQTSVEAARPGARVVLIGIPSDDRTSISASMARRKGLTVKWVRRMKHTYPRAIALVQSGAVDVRSLVTHTFSIAEFEKAFDVARKREGLKVVIEP